MPRQPYLPEYTLVDNIPFLIQKIIDRELSKGEVSAEYMEVASSLTPQIVEQRKKIDRGFGAVELEGDDYKTQIRKRAAAVGVSVTKALTPIAERFCQNIIASVTRSVHQREFTPNEDGFEIEGFDEIEARVRNRTLDKSLLTAIILDQLIQKTVSDALPEPETASWLTRAGVFAATALTAAGAMTATYRLANPGAQGKEMQPYSGGPVGTRVPPQPPVARPVYAAGRQAPLVQVVSATRTSKKISLTPTSRSDTSTPTSTLTATPTRGIYVYTEQFVDRAMIHIREDGDCRNCQSFESFLNEAGESVQEIRASNDQLLAADVICFYMLGFAERNNFELTETIKLAEHYLPQFSAFSNPNSRNFNDDLGVFLRGDVPDWMKGDYLDREIYDGVQSQAVLFAGYLRRNGITPQDFLSRLNYAPSVTNSRSLTRSPSRSDSPSATRPPVRSDSLSPSVPSSTPTDETETLRRTVSRSGFLDSVTRGRSASQSPSRTLPSRETITSRRTESASQSSFLSPTGSGDRSGTHRRSASAPPSRTLSSTDTRSDLTESVTQTRFSATAASPNYSPTRDETRSAGASITHSSVSRTPTPTVRELPVVAPASVGFRPIPESVPQPFARPASAPALAPVARPIPVRPAPSPFSAAPAPLPAPFAQPWPVPAGFEPLVMPEPAPFPESVPAQAPTPMLVPVFPPLNIPDAEAHPIMYPINIPGETEPVMMPASLVLPYGIEPNLPAPAQAENQPYPVGILILPKPVPAPTPGSPAPQAEFHQPISFPIYPGRIPIPLLNEPSAVVPALVPTDRLGEAVNSGLNDGAKAGIAVAALALAVSAIAAIILACRRRRSRRAAPEEVYGASAGTGLGDVVTSPDIEAPVLDQHVMQEDPRWAIRRSSAAGFDTISAAAVPFPTSAGRAGEAGSDHVAVTFAGDSVLPRPNLPGSVSPRRTSSRLSALLTSGKTDKGGSGGAQK